MALKEGMVMLQVSMSKEQKEWLYQFCKNHKITPSKYIRWLLSKKAEEMLILLKVDKSNIYTEDELIRIINTKWIEEE